MFNLIDQTLENPKRIGQLADYEHAELDSSDVAEFASLDDLQPTMYIRHMFSSKEYIKIRREHSRSVRYLSD
jgi:hypothetical protein